MKITLVSGIYPPDIGGPATYIPELAKYLMQAKEEVQVVSLTDGDGRSFTESWKVTLISRKSHRLSRFLRVCLKLFALNTDVYFVNGMHEEVAVINFFKRKKAVAKIVGDPVWERARNAGFECKSMSQFNSIKLPKKYLIQRKFLKWSLNRFDKIICPSEELVQTVKEWGVKTDVNYLQNGVPIRDLLPAGEGASIVSVSRLVPWKNLDVLIEACSKLEVVLEIVGVGPEEKNLRNLASELGADVKFLGNLEPKEVIEVLSKSKVFALISEYEGQSFALLQAMSLGLPVIVSDIKGNTKVVQDNYNGLVVNQNSLDSIVQTLNRLIFSSELRRYLGNNARSTVKTKFALQNNLELVHNLILELNADK